MDEKLVHICITILIVATIVLTFAGCSRIFVVSEGYENSNHISVTHSQPSHRLFVVDGSVHGPFVNAHAKGAWSELEANGVTMLPYAPPSLIEDSITQASTKRGYRHMTSSIVWIHDFMTLSLIPASNIPMLVSAMPQDATETMLLLVGPTGSPPSLKEMGASIKVICMSPAAEAAIKIVSSYHKTQNFEITVQEGGENDLEKAASLSNSSGVIVALWGCGFGSSTSSSIRCVSYATTNDFDAVQSMSKQWLITPVDIINIIPGAIIGKGGKERVLQVLSCSSGLFLYPNSHNSEFENALLIAAASSLWEKDSDALALTNYVLQTSSSSMKLVPVLEKPLADANKKIWA